MVSENIGTGGCWSSQSAPQKGTTGAQLKQSDQRETDWAQVWKMNAKPKVGVKKKLKLTVDLSVGYSCHLMAVDLIG